VSDRERIDRLLDEALDLTPEDRDRWMASLHGESPAVIEELRALLRAHDREGILDRPPLERIDRIGAYRLIRELGRGGMGRVYLAERVDGLFQHQVAVKILEGERDPAELTRRFQAERQILASLKHPNIARLLDGGVTPDGRPYMVMELIEGAPIDAWCDRWRLDVEDRLRLFCTVARALHHAHRHLVVHRDLKPSNVLVTADGVVKVLDFGIARILDPALVGLPGPVTREGLRLLTPGYASPEHVRGSGASTATDVYGLGVLLYELLTGRLPFPPDDDTREWERRILEEVPPAPSRHFRNAAGRTAAGRAAAVRTAVRRGRGEGGGVSPGDDAGDQRRTTADGDDADRGAALRGSRPDRLARRLEGDLDQIMLMALRKEPERRYPSAEAMARDVERHLDGLPVQARPEDRLYRLGRLVRRHRVEAVALAAVFASLLVGGAVAVHQAAEAERARQRAEVARERAETALAESDEVTRFLTGLFEAGDPESARGDTITARQLLARGVARAEELSDRPALQARLLGTVGEVYRTLGRYDEAQPLMERAVRLLESARPEGDPELAGHLEVLGDLHRRRARYEVADSLLNAALTLRRRHQGDDHPATAGTLAALGRLTSDRGRMEAAEALHREALAIRRAALGPDHPDVAWSELTLGAVLRRQLRIDEAEAFYRASVETHRRALGDEHPALAEALIQLGTFLQNHRGDLVEAETRIRQGAAIVLRTLGPEHPAAAGAVLRLAGIVRARGDFDGARELLEEALAIRRRVYGEEHPFVAESIWHLASELAAEGRHDEALVLFRQAADMQIRILGPLHPSVAGTLTGLGDALMATGDLPHAEATYREVVAIRRAGAEPRHPVITVGLGRLARCLLEQGRLAEAADVLEDAFGIAGEGLPAGHPDTHALLSLTAELFEAWERPEAAAAYRALLATPAS